MRLGDEDEAKEYVAREVQEELPEGSRGESEKPISNALSGRNPAVGSGLLPLNSRMESPRRAGEIQPAWGL